MSHVSDRLTFTGLRTGSSSLQTTPSLVCSPARSQIQRPTSAPPPGLGYRQIVWLLVCFAGLLLPATARGQAGYYFRPAASAAEYYDDNVFRTVSDRQDDVVSRFGAGAEAGYQSEPFTLLGHYRFESEIYAKHPQLTNAFALHDGGAQVTYLPTHLWILNFTGGWVETQLPEWINVPSGILGFRSRARNYSLSPSITHLWDPATTVTAIYTFNSTRQVGAITLDSQTARLIVDRRLSERDTLHLGYTFVEFHSSGRTKTGSSRNRSEMNHIPTVGWSRQLSPLTSFTLDIGPRFAARDRVTPEVLASVIRNLQNGVLAFTYTRTQYTVAGVGSPVTTDSVILLWERQLANRLLASVKPQFYHNAESQSDEKVYALDLAVFYQINQWLGFRGSYQFTFEKGRLIRAGPAATEGDLYRDLVLFELVAAYPMRVY
jgi:hypothetical protein